MLYSGRNETARSHDMGEQNQFLYVKVVETKDLPGSLVDPYVEVKVGNHKGVTEHSENNQYPDWNSVFAFNKETAQSNLIQVTVNDEDELLGKVVFEVNDVPFRTPSDDPLPPQWYKLEDEKARMSSIPSGEIMLAVWIGTQADEAYPEAWRCDEDPAITQSKVYLSPKLYYLRIRVIEVRDLIPSEKDRTPVASVKIRIGDQGGATKHVKTETNSPVWDEELMFVVAEPFDEHIVISVDDNGDLIGSLVLPLTIIPRRVGRVSVNSRWFKLDPPSKAEKEGEQDEKSQPSSKIHLSLCIDVGYHVQDESLHFRGDLQPSYKLLREPSVGVLELGIMDGRIMLPTENQEGRNINAYCVAKYGNKWFRTRTLVDNRTPEWNEEYCWDVYDTFTVITIGVFNNCSMDKSEEEARDQQIGKVRIRVSTLENNRIYDHRYPLLVLRPNGLMKLGELHMAVRLKCKSWVNMVKQYGKPLLPMMNYVQPLSRVQMDLLRHQAMQIVAARLSRANPPLKKETVLYMLDIDYDKFSLRRSKANFFRLKLLLLQIFYAIRWFDDICHWKNPLKTILVHVLLLIQVQYPALILPNIFLCLFVVGIWNYRFRPRIPLHSDPQISLAYNADEDEVEEELDTFPTSESIDVVRLRYDRLRSVAGHFLIVVEHLVTMLERADSILNWRDPRATSIFVELALLCAVFLKFTPLKVVSQIIILYLLRHPWLRSKFPSVAVNYFNRAPAKSDMII